MSILPYNYSKYVFLSVSAAFLAIGTMGTFSIYPAALMSQKLVTLCLTISQLSFILFAFSLFRFRTSLSLPRNVDSPAGSPDDSPNSVQIEGQPD